MAPQHIRVSMQKEILFVIYNYPTTMPDKNPNMKDLAYNSSKLWMEF